MPAKAQKAAKAEEARSEPQQVEATMPVDMVFPPVRPRYRTEPVICAGSIQVEPEPSNDIYILTSLRGDDLEESETFLRRRRQELKNS